MTIQRIRAMRTNSPTTRTNRERTLIKITHIYKSLQLSSGYSHFPTSQFSSQKNNLIGIIELPIFIPYHSAINIIVNCSTSYTKPFCHFRDSQILYHFILLYIIINTIIAQYYPLVKHTIGTIKSMGLHICLYAYNSYHSYKAPIKLLGTDFCLFSRFRAYMRKKSPQEPPTFFRYNLSVKFV